MQVKLVLGLLLVAVPFLGFAQERGTEIPYTLEDRDRMVRIEANLASFSAESTRRFESLDANLASTRSEILAGIYWGAGTLTAVLLLLVSYIFYDRRSATMVSVQPALQRIKALERELAALKAKPQGAQE
jgi:hypothetical protein